MFSSLSIIGLRRNPFQFAYGSFTLVSPNLTEGDAYRTTNCKASPRMLMALGAGT